MKLRRNQFCPIHNSLSCCGRELTPKSRTIRLGVQRSKIRTTQGIPGAPFASGDAQTAEPKDYGAEPDLRDL